MNRDKQIEKMRKEVAKIHRFFLEDEDYEFLDDYIADMLYNAGYRKQSEVIDEFVKLFEKYIGNCTFTMGQTYDIQYALKKATEEMKGGEKE